MSVHSIRLAGDPVLRKKCDKIRDFASANGLVEDLRDTLMAFRKKEGIGRGIAAPQIGISQRAIYIITSEFEGEMLNPLIVSHGPKEVLYWDACFSFKAAFFVKVLRWEEINVEFFDLAGNRKMLKATGGLSELLQHEIDHLDGILFVDRAILDSHGKYPLIMREEWEKLGRPSMA